MNEPKRMSEGGAGSEARLLVDSMRRDRLDPAARDRMRDALGIGVGIAATAAATKAAAGTKVAAGTTAAVGGKTLFGIGVAKLVAVVAIGTAAVAAVGVATTVARNPPSGTPSAPLVAPPKPTAVARPNPPSAVAPVVAPPEAPTVSVDSLPNAAAMASVGPVPIAAPQASAADVTTELAELDRAGAALRSGDPSTALSVLARYRKSRPNASMRVEADVLEIEALTASGRRDEAKSLGDRFLAAHATGPLAARVRKVIGE